MSETDPLFGANSDEPTVWGYPQTTQLSWCLLLVAIIAESFGTISMKLSNSFQNTGWSVAIFAFYAVSFTLLPIVMKKIDLSITYAVWSGVGTFVTALIGFTYFKEPVSAAKLIAIAGIILCVCALKYVDGQQEEKAGREEMP